MLTVIIPTRNREKELNNLLRALDHANNLIDEMLIYDKIKTRQYLQEKGRVGQHKGICIKNLGYAYNFNINFLHLLLLKY